jgi:hypothetical protein
MSKGIKRMHIATKLPNGKWAIDEMPGVEFTEQEFETLKKLILTETGGVHVWVI